MMRYALIATSEPRTARMMSELSRQEGLEPVVVRGGAEARVVLERNGPPALLITEQSLTRADGFELVGELRRLATPERCPALVVSAFPAFRATATSLMETLGISGVVSPAQSEAVLREAMRAALTGRTTVESLPPASPGEAAHGERSRLALIASMGLLDDQPPDEVLQKLVEDTARAFDVPIALISFILEDRQWFKAHFGLSPEIAAARSTAREISFCRHVVEGDLCEPLVVPDAASHPYFAANPLVMSGVVRSYAGAPLVTPSGQILGTLCIIDTKPLNIGPDEVDALVSLARRVAGELELKSWSRRASAGGDSGPTLALLEAVCSSVESGILVLDSGRKVLLANKALEEIFGIPTSQILEMTREEFVLRNSSRCEDRIEYLRMMRVLPDGPFSAREVFEMVKPVRRRVRWIAKPIRLPGGVGQLEIFDDVTAEFEPAESRANLGRPTTPAP